MPRPRKWRKVCCLPGNSNFGPLDIPEMGGKVIDMTVDEFEAIRLIDLECLTQEKCAERMGVARTTAQTIYNSARAKLAECLVNGRELSIHGGDYILYEGNESGCGCGHCHRRKCHGDINFNKLSNERKEENMKIAVAYENGQVFQHFGHTERFKIYDVADNKVTMATTINTNGSGHGALADILKKLNVNTLICGGIGGGAKTALTEAGIELFAGVTGDADIAVENLLTGKLIYDSDTMCSHHGEHHGGECGEHSCGGEHHHH